MKGFKEAYKSIFHYYNEHGSHENSLYISNMHWIHFIPNQSFMNILHGYKLVRLPSEHYLNAPCSIAVVQNKRVHQVFVRHSSSISYLAFDIFSKLIFGTEF